MIKERLPNNPSLMGELVLSKRNQRCNCGIAPVNKLKHRSTGDIDSEESEEDSDRAGK